MYVKIMFELQTAVAVHRNLQGKKVSNPHSCLG